jgi:hypothetical protein
MKNICIILFAVLYHSAANILFAQEPPSFGAAPYQTFVPWSLNTDYVGSRAFVYGYTGSGNQYQLYKHFLANTSTTAVGSTSTYSYPGGATVMTSTNTLYVVELSSPFTLYTVDTTTGTRTTIANLTGISFTNVTGLTWNPQNSTMYGLYSNLSQSGIFTINITTGACTAIGSPSATCAGGISLSSSRTGTLFVIDIVADNLYKVNKSTGAFSLVGSLGIPTNYGQDAQFDMNPSQGLSDNKLYWASYTTIPELRIIDTTNGTSTVIGTYAWQAYTIGIFGKNPTSTNDLNNAQVSIFPNPSSSIFNIEANNIETYKVMNVAGQVISDVVVNNNNAKIDVSSYDAGVYIVQVKTHEGLITRKITVTK